MATGISSKERILRALKRANLSKENKQAEIVNLYLAWIIRKMKHLEKNKISFHFCENEEIFQKLKEKALEENIKISRPIFGRLRKKIVAKKTTK